MTGQSADLVGVKIGVYGMLKRLWPYFMRRKWRFFLTIAAVFLVALAGRLAVTLFGYAIDHGLREKSRSVIIVIAAIYFVSEAIRCYLTYLQNSLFAKIGNNILFEIRSRLLAHVEALPISFFERNPTGRIITRVTTDVAGLGEIFTQGLISLFAAVVTLIAIVGAMLAISVRMTLLTLMISPPLIWVVARISGKILLVLRESKRKMAEINAFVAENVNGMRVAQLYGRVDKNVDHFNKMSFDYRNQQMETVRLYALLWPAVSFFNAASVGAALFFGGRFVLAGEVSTGAMVAFLLHVRAFIDPLHQILEKYQNLQNSVSGAERIFTLLEEPTEHGADLEQTTKTPRPKTSPEMSPETRLSGHVVFDRMSFRYESHRPLVLQDISLDVQPGQSIALVGRTGSGKSTLISLLQRFYEPTAGKILIDTQPIEHYDRIFLRSRIGVVQQDTFLFRGTIADNISLGDPRISRAQIERAAELACLQDIMRGRTDGLDAKVEERGANLSVGERQLIAFARIIAFDPDILILDEATANIDSHTENLIQVATKQVRQGRTSFIIAHRISTIQDCDQIVVLEAGRIIEKGTDGELRKHGGVYSALSRAQHGRGQIVDSTSIIR